MLSLDNICPPKKYSADGVTAKSCGSATVPLVRFRPHEVVSDSTSVVHDTSLLSVRISNQFTVRKHWVKYTAIYYVTRNVLSVVLCASYHHKMHESS